MDYKTISYQVDADPGVATVTLDRPDRLNAFTVRMCDELLDAFDRIDADPGVRVVIVTGRGRGFCAGADLSGGSATFRAPAERLARAAPRDSGGQVSLRVFRCLKPVIAAINGPAVGVGITMTLPMDVRMIAEGAKVGFVFGARGIVPEAASSWFLPRLVGISQALEWCLTARMLSASEALGGGLVRSVHPAEDLLPAARALAAEMAANVAPVSAAVMRQMLWRMLGASHPMDAHRMDSQAMALLGPLADAAEGIEAFVQKRPATWRLQVPGDVPDWHPWWEEPTYDPEDGGR